MTKDRIRVITKEKITYKDEKDIETIVDIFEFSLSEWTLKSGHFGARINTYLMEAYTKVASQDAVVIIEKANEQDNLPP